MTDQIINSIMVFAFAICTFELVVFFIPEEACLDEMEADRESKVEPDEDGLYQVMVV